MDKTTLKIIERGCPICPDGGHHGHWIYEYEEYIYNMQDRFDKAIAALRDIADSWSGFISNQTAKRVLKEIDLDREEMEEKSHKE